MFDINNSTSIKDLRTFMSNARKVGRMDLYWTAFRRICELQARPDQQPVASDFWVAIAAVEELLFIKHGRRLKAQRTRNQVKKVGEKQCLADWVMRPTETKGFHMLLDAGLVDLTGEAIVLKYGTDVFEPDIVLAAEARLKAPSGREITAAPS